MCLEKKNNHCVKEKKIDIHVCTYTERESIKRLVLWGPSLLVSRSKYILMINIKVSCKSLFLDEIEHFYFSTEEHVFSGISQ